MGFGGIGATQLLIILVIVALIFGTKKLRTIGSDVGGAVKGFRKAMGDEEAGDKTGKQVTDATSVGSDPVDERKETDKTS